MHAALFPATETDDFQQRMQRVGDVYRAADVRTIYLVHGTFAGPDALGILSEMRRLVPGVSDSFAEAAKGLINALASDRGNYTDAYAREFEGAINTGDRDKITVRLLNWSSENHHIGRADGAVRMVDQLAREHAAGQQRVLFWGHSHAGNVFALTSHLLGADIQSIREFFDAARCYFVWPLLGWIDMPMWHRVEQRLIETEPPTGSLPPIDFVTFGTPIRYGWDGDGYDRLLHFVNHRPRRELPEYRTLFPPSPADLLEGTDGDYVQQLGIAGTNIMPGIFTWRSWLADDRLDDLLERDLSPDNLLKRWAAGQRVPDEGETLLVDYGKPEGLVTRHLAGHAVYTQREWLLFHAEQVAMRLYEEPRPVASGDMT